MLMTTAIILAAVFILLYKYYTRKFDYWEKRNVFYFKPVPFFGNMLEFMKKDNPLGKSMLDIWNATGNRDYFGVFFFDRPVLMVTCPKLVKSIMQRDFSNFADRTVSNMSRHPVMSNALFFQRNPLWREVRTKLSPIFTSGKLKLMFPLMVEESDKMVDYISTKANIPDVEVKEICSKYSTNVITRCAFAVDANCFKHENAIFRKLGSQMVDFRLSTAIRQLGSFFAPDLADRLNITFIDSPTIDSLEEIFTDVLRTRKTSTNLKCNDFIEILLEAQRTNGDKGFSEKAMLGQAIQFFAAGFETVSSTMAFTLYELCVNPDIQEKLRNEINESLQKNDGLTYETLHELKYLDMVISESLRKYPPGAFLDRKCKENYKLEGTDLVIEKGTFVYIPTYALHYNPQYFPDPEKFDPERFADKSSINKDGLWYVPFGDGPRICIGQRFGLMEAKIALVSILSKYRLEKSPKTPIPIKFSIKSLILQSTVGIPLKFVPI